MADKERDTQAAFRAAFGELIYCEDSGIATVLFIGKLSGFKCAHSATELSFLPFALNIHYIPVWVSGNLLVSNAFSQQRLSQAFVKSL